MGSILFEKIQEDFTTSRKDPSLKLELSVLTLLLSAIKNKQIDERKDLTDDEIISIIKKAVKERTDSIEIYAKAGRDELAEKEKQEMSILKKYLPEDMSDADIEKIVDGIFISEGEKKDPKQFGIIMKKVLDQIKEQRKSADGGKVSNIVRGKLSS